MAMAASDGDLDPLEAAVVKTWLTRLHGTHGTEADKEKLNRLVKRSGQAALSGRLDIRAAARELREKAPQTFRLEVLEVCAEVLAADGTAAKEEMALVDQLIGDLDLERSVCRALLDKRFMAGGLELEQGGNKFSAIGISRGMPREKIKAAILEEFRKWRARQNNSDASVRIRAKEMLDLIAEARKELL